MALTLEEREGARLPGELPPAFRRLRRRNYNFEPAISQRNLCSSSADGLAAEVYPGILQENHITDPNEEDEDLFKVVERLDQVIEHLAKSCKVKPTIQLHIDSKITAEEPFDLRIMEDRMDQIIQKLSKSGFVGRVNKELCGVRPVRAEAGNGKPAPMSPSSASCQKLADADDDDTLSRAPPSHDKLARTSFSPGEIPPKTPDDGRPHNAISPSSSFRMPLLTPKCLLSKFGSAEKAELPASPGNSRRLSGSRSGRFLTALSFLASPRKAGCGSSGRVGSPTIKPAGDACL